MATVIRPDGICTEVHPENGKAFTLQELYRHTECDLVEMVGLPNGDIMWLDEEGKLNGSPYNPVATALYNSPFDVVMGTVLVVPPWEDEQEED